MQNEGIHWLNQYKFTSGKSWREVARDLEIPEQVILSWLSGANTPSPHQTRELQRLLGQLGRTEDHPPRQAQQPIAPAPSARTSTQPAESSAHPEPVSAPPSPASGNAAYTSPPMIPCLAEGLVEMADGLEVERLLQEGIVREGIPMLPIRTNISKLESAFDGLPLGIYLHARTMEVSRITAVLIAQSVLEQNPTCGILFSSDLPAAEWRRLWLVLACACPSARPSTSPQRTVLDHYLHQHLPSLERVWFLPDVHPDPEETNAVTSLLQRLERSLQVDHFLWFQESVDADSATLSLKETAVPVSQILYAANPPGNRHHWPLIGRASATWNPDALADWLETIDWSGAAWLLPPA